MSLGHATQQQKLQSSHRFGVFRADFPTRLLLQRSVFFTDTLSREMARMSAQLNCISREAAAGGAAVVGEQETRTLVHEVSLK